MKQEGKFILMNREELKTYIEGLKGSKKYTNIQQHNTGDPDYKDFKNNHIAMMKSMENYHINNKGMSEIAQHFSTFPDGLICVGRPLTKDGGGFLGKQNTNAITLEHVGNFDTDIMTEEQKKSIVLLNSLLCKKFNIIPSTVTLPYHCWVKSTQCPGLKFFGGRTKIDAEKNFIPLIKAKIDELYNPKPVIKPKTYIDILNEVSSNANEWKTAIDLAISSSKKTELKSLSIIQYLNDLIVKIYDLEYTKELTWTEIIDKVSSDSDEWKIALNAGVGASKADGNLGELEIFKYLPQLIVNIYKK